MATSVFRLMRNAILGSEATFFLVFANVAYYLVACVADNRAFSSLGLEAFLVQWGASTSALVFSGEYWRLLSSMFMHVGIPHLLMNMAALLALGQVLERKIGPAALFTIYLVGGLSGGLVSALWHTEGIYVSCGSSGAILALAGGVFALILNGNRFAELPIKNLSICLVLTFSSGFFFQIDNAAHLGGLVSGFVHLMLMQFVCIRRQALKSVALSGISMALLLVIVGAGAMHYNADRHDVLVAARLLDVLGHIGLGDPGSSYSGVKSLEECVSGILSEESEQDTKIEKLRQCNEPWMSSGRVAILLKKEHERCREAVLELKSVYTDSGSLAALAIVDRYCLQQDRLYAVVFSEAAKDFNLASTLAAREEMELSLEASIGYPADQVRIVPAARALNAIFARVSETDRTLVWLKSCPLTSCSRF